MAGAVLKDGVEVGLDGKRIARGPVGERDPLADMEGVDLAVGGDIPAFGQAGLVAVGRDVHQGLEEHFLGVHLTGVQVRVQIPDIPVVDKYQLIPRTRFTVCVGRASAWSRFAPLSAAGERRQQQGAAQQHRKNPSFHKSLQS